MGHWDRLARSCRERHYARRCRQGRTARGKYVLPPSHSRSQPLQAEYLPLPNWPYGPNQTPELFSNFLTSLLPAIPDAKTVAVTVHDQEWDEVLCSEADELDDVEDAAPVIAEDDVYAHDYPEPQRHDWTGLDRDRRSAFMIHGVLRSEGLL